MWTLSLFLLTLTVYMLPLAPALQELRKRKDAKPVNITLSHDGDIQFFANSFREYIRREIDALVSHRVTRERRESYALVKNGGTFEPERAESRRRATQKIILAAGSLALPNDFTFEREVYSKGPITGGINNRFRAILSDKELTVGNGGTVLRWAHGELVQASPNCRFLGRLSADRLILIQPPCQFQRMNAPRIRFGEIASPDNSSEQHLQAVELAVPMEPISGPRCIVDGDLHFSANTYWVGDIVGRRNVTIGASSRIHGSIKAHGSIRLGDNVTVRGALVARGGITTGENSKVAGPIVSDKHIEIVAGTIVGANTAPSTVTAPSITVDSDVMVCGTVWARDVGHFVGGAADAHVENAWSK